MLFYSSRPQPKKGKLHLPVFLHLVFANSPSRVSMDTLQSTYGDEEDHEQNPIDNGNDPTATACCNGVVSVNLNPSTAEVCVTETVIDTSNTTTTLNSTSAPATTTTTAAKVITAELVRNSTSQTMAVDTAVGVETLTDIKEEQLNSEDMSSEFNSDEELLQNPTPGNNCRSPDPTRLSDEDEPPPKKQMQLSSLTPQTPATAQQSEADTSGAEPSSLSQPKPVTNGKKSSKKKSKNNNVWTKPTSRKGKKKSKNNNNQNSTPKPEDTVLITPIPRFPDKNDDSPDLKTCLSKVYKAEKVELSEDRMTASSCKGYRMVRATRGVTEGAWYFEIKLVYLGETGHTRLGWSTEKGDLQAPVGYDANSFGYRDIDGSKIHKAAREKYGDEGYHEGDVIGFYINLPQGNLYAPKPPQMVWYKGQKYVCAPDPKEDPPKVIPGSEISFFKNGICQGVAYKDLVGGLYFPAASMYTLPNQPNCVVRFNFGPDFEYVPDFGGRPAPRPMTEVPYNGFHNQVENGVLNEKKQ